MVNETLGTRSPSVDTVDHVIALVSSALHGRKGPAKPNGVEWDDLYRLVAVHAIQPMTFPALTTDDLDGMPSEVFNKWQQTADMALYQQVNYDAERAAIVEDFRKAGLSWLPLKGIMVATYYPQPGMRSMSDQDLLVAYVEPDADGYHRLRGSDEDECRRWGREADAVESVIMKKHGYREWANENRVHSFVKPPLHFELHKSLLSAAEVVEGVALRAEIDYYANPWRLAKPVGQVPGEFRFDTVDEYVFHIDHMSKHYRGSGFGLRFIVDEYLYCTKFPEIVRSESTNQILRKLGLDYFEKIVRELSVAMFDHPDDWRKRIGRDAAKLFDDVLSGGTYGSLKRGVARRLSANSEMDMREDGRLRIFSDTRQQRVSSLQYLRERLFPSKTWTDVYYPKWSRNVFTRFLLMFYRVFRVLWKRPGNMWREIRALWEERWER